MDQEKLQSMLSSANLTTSTGSFNWANIICGLIFGTIGMVAFMYGKKERSMKPLGIGLFLMVYPYFIPNTTLMYIVGIAATAALYFWRD